MKNHSILWITIAAAAVLGIAVFAWPDDVRAPGTNGANNTGATSTQGGVSNGAANGAGSGAVATSSPEFGLSFSYPSTYKATVRDIDRTHRIHRHIDLTEGEAVPNGEGSTSITIDIYQNNLDRQTAHGFVTGHSDSNYKLGSGAIATTTYGSLQGLEYTWSGLYEGRSFVVSRPDWIYIFSVTRLDPTDKILGDFEDVLETVRIEQ